MIKHISRSGRATFQEETEGELAEKILNTLEKQKFADWYNSGGFDQYITGEIPKEQMSYDEQKKKVLNEIKKMFRLE